MSTGVFPEVQFHARGRMRLLKLLSIYIATTDGWSRLRLKPRSSHQPKNIDTALAYARRVFLFLMFAVKNSMNL